jgi:hypothetical protein
MSPMIENNPMCLSMNLSSHRVVPDAQICPCPPTPTLTLSRLRGGGNNGDGSPALPRVHCERGLPSAARRVKVSLQPKSSSSVCRERCGVTGGGRHAV